MGKRLVVILGDQLNNDSSAIRQLDAERDRIWMAEAHEESTHVWSSKLRIACFLSAMRHFRDELVENGYRVIYHPLDAEQPASLADILTSDLRKTRPSSVHMVQAGDFRVQQSIERAVADQGIEFHCLPDRHFLCDRTGFAEWADGRRQLRLENFYRFLRKRHHILMTSGAPAGGAWNFDKENRKAFPRSGPGMTPPWPAYTRDRITREVERQVAASFGEHPGELTALDWPLTRRDARHALEDFIEHRLPVFGPYQDAMWTDEPFLYHSGLAAALNLKLLDPREVIDAAVEAWQSGQAPLPSVEGFVRQVLGWREFVRGIYWRHMPEYIDRNALQAAGALPAFYWNGDTDMVCLRQVITQTLKYGYAHHIQRLMVSGLFALLLGVHPRRVHEWYLAVYVDAVEWVELPNTLGMSQYADGGLLASKPYVASGRYIDRMSNYCRRCRYRPDEATGDEACPFTTLYWDFLQRHEERFRRHPRTALQWRNLDRLDDAAKRAVRARADRLRQLYQ